MALINKNSLQLLTQAYYVIRKRIYKSLKVTLTSLDLERPEGWFLP